MTSTAPRGNLLALTVTRVIVAASGLIVNVALARMLSRDDMGLYQWVLSLAALGNFGATLGLGAWVTREVARDASQQASLVPRALMTAGLSSVVTAVAMVAYVAMRNPQPEVLVAGVFGAVAVMINGAAQITTGGLHGLRRMGLELVPMMAGRTVLVATQLIGLALGVGLGTLFAGRAVGALVLLLGLWWTQWRQVGPYVVRVTLAHIREVGRQGLMFGATVLFGAIYAQADTLMVEAFVGLDEVARYRVPAVVLLQLAFVATILARGLYPRFSQLTGHVDKAGELLGFQTRMLLLVSIPVAAGGVVVAGPLIVALMGSAYDDVAPVFVLLLLAVPVRFLNAGFGLSLTALGQQHRRWRIDGWGAVLNVGLNLAAIPFLGAEGAALTTLLTDVVVCAAIWREIGRVAQTPGGFFAGTGRIVVGGVGMAGLVWAAAPLGLVAQLALGVVSFPSLTWLLRCWTLQDIRRLRRV